MRLSYTSIGSKIARLVFVVLLVLVALILVAPGNGASARDAAVSVNLSPLKDCADTIGVSNDTDSDAGSLRQAIADVCPGGTITFTGDLTILLSSQLIISKSMTIDGAEQSVVVSGGNITRTFYVDADTFNLQNLGVTDGYCGDCSGAGLYSSGLSTTVSIINVTFSYNVAGENGGDGRGEHVA